MSQKYIDNEADFWKELFVHLQHKNMVRTNAQALRLENCKAAFDEFAAAHPDVNISTEYNGSYCTFEVTLTATIKLRLYIQSAIKGSLMQKNGTDFIKLCDAKFPYNPLPEIDEFLTRLPEYLKELEQSLENKSRTHRRQKLALEFIKAYANTHLKEPYEVHPNEDGTFIFSLPAKCINLQISEDNFKQKIDEL
ncbi:MAG: hypothetical protein K6A15_05650 [Treponema sp.]|nr:hypothetical protein [Treponema sp.]